MKFALTFVLLLTSTLAFSQELAREMVGTYAVQSGNCDYDTATVSVKSRTFHVTLKNTSTSGFNSEAIDLENMWTKIRTTVGMKRVVRQYRQQKNSLIVEEKTCLPGWVGCSEFETTARITKVDADVIEAQLSPTETACRFKKI